MVDADVEFGNGEADGNSDAKFHSLPQLGGAIAQVEITAIVMGLQNIH